jgi:hypothetical protein
MFIFALKHYQIDDLSAQPSSAIDMISSRIGLWLSRGTPPYGVSHTEGHRKAPFGRRMSQKAAGL